MYDKFKPIFDSIEGEIFLNKLSKEGEIFFVGGCVRDCFLGLPSKDIDILVTGVPATLIKSIIRNYGKVTETAVGDKFGVIKFVSDITGNDYDLSIPRKEVKTGDGHTGFDVFSDPNLSVEDDLSRRDFTINSIALDINKRIIDPFDGLSDLNNKLIRKVSEKSFSDDALRMLRAIQFVSRFEDFKIETDTENSIRIHAPLIKEITAERVLEELDKIYYKGDKVKGIMYLVNTQLHFNLFNRRHGANYIKKFNVIKSREDFYFSILYDQFMNNDPSVVFKRGLSGDAKTESVLKSIYEIVNEPIMRTIDSVEAMKIIFDHNKNFKRLCLSNILNSNRSFSSAFHNFLMEGYPITYNDLNISGDFLLDKTEPKNIGVIKKKLLYEVFEDKIINERSELENRALVLLKEK